MMVCYLSGAHKGQHAAWTPQLGTCLFGLGWGEISDQCMMKISQFPFDISDITTISKQICEVFVAFLEFYFPFRIHSEFTVKSISVGSVLTWQQSRYKKSKVGLLAKKFTKEGLNLNVMDGLVPWCVVSQELSSPKQKGLLFSDNIDVRQKLVLVDRGAGM